MRKERTYEEHLAYMREYYHAHKDRINQQRRENKMKAKTKPTRKRERYNVDLNDTNNRCDHCRSLEECRLLVKTQSPLRCWAEWRNVKPNKRMELAKQPAAYLMID